MTDLGLTETSYYSYLNWLYFRISDKKQNHQGYLFHKYYIS